MGKTKEELQSFTLSEHEKAALRTVRDNCKARASRLYRHASSCRALGAEYHSSNQLAWAFDFLAWVCDKVLSNGIPTRWRGGEHYVES